MNEPQDSPGRLFVDIGVTIVLFFAGIFAAQLLADRIAPDVGIVYPLCLWGAFTPFGLWLHRCRVLNVTRSQVAAFFIMTLVLSVAIDLLLPNLGAGMPWFVPAILAGLMRAMAWLFVRVPLLRSQAKQQAEE